MRTQERVPDEGDNTRNEDLRGYESEARNHVTGFDRRSNACLVRSPVAHSPANLTACPEASTPHRVRHALGMRLRRRMPASMTASRTGRVAA